MYTLFQWFLISLALLRNQKVVAFMLSPGPTKVSNLSESCRAHETQMQSQSSETDRRSFVSKSCVAGLVSILSSAYSQSAVAADDLTSQMFNEDGSLKDGVIDGNKAEAKDITVTVPFPAPTEATSAIISVDGKGIKNSIEETMKISASYQIPDKWTSAPDYLDTLLSVREKACERISVFQVPGVYKDYSVLDKATSIGIAKVFNFKSIEDGVFPKTLASADIVSGRKVQKPLSRGDDDDKMRKYYEFDLAVAPDKCGNSEENLGLGFCPYDTIVLLSATIIEGKMMVCGVTCTKNEWKRSNADIKRLRNSFFVEPISA